MSKIPIGVQLYSVRDDCARDLPGTLAALAKAGYQGVEFAGYYGYNAGQLRKLLADNGLKCCGTHIGLDTLTGDELKRTIEFNQEIGNPYLVVPWLPEKYRETKSAWLAIAKQFNGLAEQLAPLKMQVGYHNHREEFLPLNGEIPFDIFFGNTVQGVIMQYDIGNSIYGGADPIAVLKRYPARTTTIHLKEYSKTNPKALTGEGDVPWKEVFDLCESQGGTQWYIVEQESYAVPPLEAVALCLKNLNKMGKGV